MTATPEDLATSRIASLTLVNAMIFQQVIAQLNARIGSLERVLRSKDVAHNLDTVWTRILDEIDYVPIFSLARDIVRELAGTPGFDDALQGLGGVARRITTRRAALRHDLMGRVYHRLLADAKYFGAYYTSIPAATLCTAPDFLDS
jgi:hypothetical protein